MIRYLLLLFPVFVFAQDLRISKDVFDYQFDADTGLVYLLTPKQLITYNLDKMRLVDSITLSHELNLKEYKMLKTSKDFLFLEEYGGKVHRLQHDSLVRIDYSFSHKMQIQASNYVQNDTIFRYGGYGFWSMRNFITYFDPGVQEWEWYDIKIKIKNGIYKAIHLAKGNKHSFIKGIGLHPDNPLKDVPNTAVRVLDLDKKELYALGELHHELSAFEFGASGEEEHFLFKLKEMAVVNFENNTMAIVEAPKVFWQSKGKKGFENTLDPFYYNNELFVFTFKNQVGEAYLSKVSMEAIQNSPVRVTGKAYIPPTNYTRLFAVFGGLAFIAIVLYLWFWFYQRRFVIVKKDRIVFKGRILHLKVQMVAVLGLLIRNPDGVRNEQILALIQNDDLDYSYNVKLKNELMKTLNAKLKSFLGTPTDSIVYAPSTTDKRIKEYRLNQRHKFKLATKSL